MFYILIAFICFVFCYALFLDGKSKIDITYDKESIFSDNDFETNPRIIYKCDKKKYHFKSAFIGIFIENNIENEEVLVTRDYKIEILKDDKWYELPFVNTENIEKEIKIKFKEAFYQNIFIDKYKNLNDCDLRIIKKIKINGEEKTLCTKVSIHSLKSLKVKTKK